MLDHIICLFHLWGTLVRMTLNITKKLIVLHIHLVYNVDYEQI